VLAPLKSAIGTAPTYSFSGSNSYLSAMEMKRLLGPLDRGVPSDDPEPGRPPQPRGVFGEIELRGRSHERRAGGRVHQRGREPQHTPTLGGGLAFDSYGGAINRVASDATAFVHRDKLACIQATYSLSSYTPPSVIAAGARWLAWLGRHVLINDGRVSELHRPTLANWPNAYYGANLSRLASIKSEYDPATCSHSPSRSPDSLERSRNLGRGSHVGLVYKVSGGLADSMP